MAEILLIGVGAMAFALIGGAMVRGYRKNIPPRFSRLIGIRPLSPEADALKSGALAGDEDAVRDWLYWCAWQKIISEKSIPPNKKRTAFRALVKADPLANVPVTVTGNG